MFLWKSAVVLVGLLGIAALPALMLVRERWEGGYLVRLAICGMLVACIAVSAVPMLGTQILFALLLVACFDRRVPMGATYLFFFFWTPAAGALLAIAGAYVAPLTPFMAFAGALLLGWLVNRAQHLRRPVVMSDVYLLAFLAIFCVCSSLRQSWTESIRIFATYFLPYALSYALISRLRIGRPELLLRLMLFGAAAGGLLCIFELVRHWPLYSGIMGVKHELWIIDAPRGWIRRAGIARSYGPYAHPLTGGAMLALAAVAAWALLAIRGRSPALAALALAVLLGLASTLSRSGLVIIAVGVTLFQLLRGRYLLAWAAPLAAALIVFGLPILGGADAQFSTDYRLRLITGVPRVLGSRIWLGYGEAIDEGLLDGFIQGQGIVDLVNVYVALVVRGGIVSLVPYLLFLLSALSHYRAIRRMRPDRDQLLVAQALVALLGATSVALALLSSWSAPMQLGFVLVALLVALRMEVARNAAAEAPARVPLVATPPPDAGERLPALR
jgi:O-antigen ligase